MTIKKMYKKDNIYIEDINSITDIYRKFWIRELLQIL
jgi:hypothetical protein